MSQADLSTQINAAIGAHGAWKVRLKAAINTGTCDITPAVASCDDKCAFGGWLYGSGVSPATRSGVPYQVIRRLHAEFHQCAGQVLTHVTTGNKAGAQQLMDGEFTERSDKLVRALHKWKREAA